MKILTLNANLKQIGTYGRCFYFSRELARHGHDVTMVTVSRDSKYRPKVYYKREYTGEYAVPAGDGPWVRIIEGPNLGYKWLPGWGSGPLDIWLRIKEIFTDDYDVVYGFEYQPDVSWPVYLTRPFKSYRFFSDWCDWYAGGANWLRGYKWAHRIDAFFEERIRFLAQKVTVTSRVLRQRALSIGIPETKIAWIPQGVDTEYCKPYPKDETRTLLGFPVDRPIVLAVRENGMEPEVYTFYHVLKQIPEAIFIAVGSIPEEGRSLARRLGIDGSICWTGWVSDQDYPRYISCADVCFLPLDNHFLNDRANWTGKFLDYLSCGRPVVTNDVGEEGALLRKHEVGLLAVPGDEKPSAPVESLLQDKGRRRFLGESIRGLEELATAIVTLLRDKERARFLGENARRLMVEEWDWRVRGEQIARVVEE